MKSISKTIDWLLDDENKAIVGFLVMTILAAISAVFAGVAAGLASGKALVGPLTGCATFLAIIALKS